jgi:hypothetical protein
MNFEIVIHDNKTLSFLFEIVASHVPLIPWPDDE